MVSLHTPMRLCGRSSSTGLCTQLLRRLEEGELRSPQLWRCRSCWRRFRGLFTFCWELVITWSMTLALKIASSMCRSSVLMTNLMLLTTCWTSGGRLQLECSRNFATSILVSLYVLMSTKERGRSLEMACNALGFKQMSPLLASLCLLEDGTCLTAPWQDATTTESSGQAAGSGDVCGDSSLT